MKLVIASNNKNKIREIKQILLGEFQEIVSMKEAGLILDIEETGETFRENAILKAEEVAKILPDCAVIADDSGLEVKALHGKPGVHSARYSGKHGDDSANNEKLLLEMKEIKPINRGARYACAMALCRPNVPTITAFGTCPGEILEEYRGDGGFGYDPLFFMHAFDCSMAQMPNDIKNSISHRKNAIEGILSILKYEKNNV